MKIGFFQVIGLIGLLAKELSIAAEDGKITLHEAITIIIKICETLGLDFDREGFDIDKI